jgi:hypothetical protein
MMRKCSWKTVPLPPMSHLLLMSILLMKVGMKTSLGPPQIVVLQHQQEVR